MEQLGGRPGREREAFAFSQAFQQGSHAVLPGQTMDCFPSEVSNLKECLARIRDESQSIYPQSRPRVTTCSRMSMHSR